MRWLIIYILTFSFSFSKLQAQTIVETYNFADQLFDKGNYDAALQAYKRIDFFESKQNWSLQSKIATCEWAVNQRFQALNSLNRAFYICEEEAELKVLYFTKLSYLIQLEDYKGVLEEILNSDLNLDSIPKKREYFFAAISNYALENFAQSKINFSHCLHPDDSEGQFRLDSLFSDTINFSKPNPLLAKSLSYIIPGLGQMYAGDSKDGLNSLLLNAAFIGLFVYTANLYTVLDATLFVYPWLRGYYVGGTHIAEETAIQSQEEKKAANYYEILKLIENK